MKRPPLVMRLPKALLGNFNLAAMIADDHRWSGSDARFLLAHFDMMKPERRFVLRVLRERTNYRLFRTIKTKGCADFAAVDMSLSDQDSRPLLFIELKTSHRLVHAGAGNPQFRHCAEAHAELARDWPIVTPDAPVIRLIGEEEELIDWMGREGRWDDFPT